MGEIVKSEIFTLNKKHSDKSFSDYMFWKTESGWHFVKTLYNVDYDPKTVEMSIPNEIFDRILTEGTKGLLNG